MKNYFVYLLKKYLLLLACFALLCVIVYVIPITVESYTAWNKQETTYVDLYYSNISAVLGVMSVLIPIALLSYKMSRRSADMHYSLPIGRRKILCVHFLVGLILLYASYSFAYLWGFIIIAATVRHLQLIYYLYLYLSSLLPALVLYSLTAFLYTRANTMLDGIVIVVSAMCLLPLAFGTTCRIIDPHLPSTAPSLDSARLFPFVSLMEATDVLGTAAEGWELRLWFTNFRPDYIADDALTLAGSLFWLIAGAGAAAGLFVTEKTCKAENCGQRTESLFGYKTLLPAYTVFLTAMAFEDAAVLCIVAFGILVLSVLYKRTIKIGWKFAAVLAACFVAGILLYVIPEYLIKIPPRTF